MDYIDYGGGDYQTADHGCVWLSGCRSKTVGAAWPALWYKSAAAVAVCGLWRHISVICLCLCPLG